MPLLPASDKAGIGDRLKMVESLSASLFIESAAKYELLKICSLQSVLRSVIFAESALTALSNESNESFLLFWP